MTVSDFQFVPPDRRKIWRELTLTMSQAAALTGVSERQIQHWMDRGYVDLALDGGRKISGNSLDCILLIKQARSAGIPLRRAVPMARAYLAREAAGALDNDMARQAMGELQDKLASARDEIVTVEELLRELSPTSRGDAFTDLQGAVVAGVSSCRYP